MAQRKKTAIIQARRVSPNLGDRPRVLSYAACGRRFGVFISDTKQVRFVHASASTQEEAYSTAPTRDYCFFKFTVVCRGCGSLLVASLHRFGCITAALPETAAYCLMHSYTVEVCYISNRLTRRSSCVTSLRIQFQ